MIDDIELETIMNDRSKIIDRLTRSFNQMTSSHDEISVIQFEEQFSVYKTSMNSIGHRLAKWVERKVAE